MPTFKTLKEAKVYGRKNCFTPEYTQTVHGNWGVKDQYDKIHKPVKKVN